MQVKEGKFFREITKRRKKEMGKNNEDSLCFWRKINVC